MGMYPSFRHRTQTEILHRVKADSLQAAQDKVDALNADIDAKIAAI